MEFKFDASEAIKQKKVKMYRAQDHTRAVVVKSVDELNSLDGQQAMLDHGVVVLKDEKAKMNTFLFEGGYFSNFVDAVITVFGVVFSCTEQFFQFTKGVVALKKCTTQAEKDYVHSIMAAIMVSPCPKYMQDLAKGFTNIPGFFDEWQTFSLDVLEYAFFVKSTAHPKISEFVNQYNSDGEDFEIVECNEYDGFYGIHYNLQQTCKNYPKITTYTEKNKKTDLIETKTGQNEMGKIATRVLKGAYIPKQTVLDLIDGYVSFELTLFTKINEFKVIFAPFKIEEDVKAMKSGFEKAAAAVRATQANKRQKIEDPSVMTD